MANITVDGNTRLADLARLTQNADDSNKTLRAKHNAQGDVVLYVKEGKSSFLDKITGRAENRQQRAAEAVKTVLKNENNALRGVKGGVGDLSSYMESITSTKFRAGEVYNLASNLSQVHDMLPKIPPKTLSTNPGLEGPGLRDLGVGADVIQGLGNDLSNTSADTLGDAIATSFKNKPGAGQNDWDTFGRSGAMKLRGELTAALTKDGGDGAQVKDFVDAAVNRAVSKMLPDKVVGGTMTTILETDKDTGVVKDHKLPNIMVGNQEFKPSQFLGSGAFGMAVGYENVNDPSDKIALKLPLDSKVASTEERANAVANFAAEAAKHRTAQGNGSDQVLGIKAEIRFPDGRLAIAMETAPHGDVGDLTKNIQSLVDSKKLSPEMGNLLRLTMIKDMALGLRHLSKQNLLHLDFKSPNCFVGTDGTVKVADFGGSKESRTANLNDLYDIENPFWLAPEVLDGRDVVAKMTRIGIPEQKAADKEAKEQLKGLLPNATQETIDNLAKSVKQTKTDARNQDAAPLQQASFFNGAADMWGLGSTALQMFTGKLAAERHWSTDSMNVLSAFAANRGGDPLDGKTGADGYIADGGIGKKTGDGAIDSLLTGMLQANPTDRSKPSDVLKNDVFNRAGVGSAEAKALLVAIQSGPLTKDKLIDDAIAALKVVGDTPTLATS